MNIPLFRYALLTAVSTDNQAHEDKASLGDQEKTARRAGEQQGGEETAGPFVVDGYSRTGYVNLTDALVDIPPLAAAMEAAEQDRYDVLIVDNIERLGDLAPMVSTFLKRYRKQIHSARQPSRIFDPAEYDPFADESSDIMIHVEGIIQKYRINKLQRGRRIGMPRRIDKGLTPNRVPFAYTHAGSKEPPRLDPVRGALLQQLKDLLLKGRSLNALAQHADASGIAPPNGGGKWDISAIKYMLANPYYAGVVSINRIKYIYDPKRKKKKRPVPQPRVKWKEGQGRHEPLWDAATHRAIVQELERRFTTNQYFASRFALSGLLTCSECRLKLHRRSHGHAPRWKVWSCKVGPAHVILPYEELVDLVAQELVIQLQQQEDTSTEPQEDVDQTEAAKAALNKERKRVQDGYKSGIYSDAEASQEIARIENQLEILEQQVVEREGMADIQAEFMEQFQGHLDQLPWWIRNDDPQIVNRLLSALCEDIIVHPDRRIEIIKRKRTRTPEEVENISRSRVDLI